MSAVQVKSFGNPEEVHEWLVANPMRCTVALHFTETNLTFISYGIQSNKSAKFRKGQKSEASMEAPLQFAAEREIARSLLGGAFPFVSVTNLVLSFFLFFQHVLIRLVR